MKIRKYYMLALLLPFVYSAQSYSANALDTSTSNPYVAERGGGRGGEEHREAGRGGEERRGGEGRGEAYRRGYDRGNQGEANININPQQQPEVVPYPYPGQFDSTTPPPSNPPY